MLRVLDPLRLNLWKDEIELGWARVIRGWQLELAILVRYFHRNGALWFLFILLSRRPPPSCEPAILLFWVLG